MKQVVKKGAGIKSKGGLSAYKSKIGLTSEKMEQQMAVSNANKPQDWILMPKAFQDATKLPGIPTCTVISVIGHSNVGKTTLLNHAITSAQRQGIVPVIIDTENSFSFQYAKSMGFEAEPVYAEVEVDDIDTETGEVTGTRKEKQIINWEGDFIYYNNTILCDQFGQWDYAKGTETKSKRRTAVIEDVAMCVNTLLTAQEDGELPFDLLFVWDSVGSIGSFKEYNSGKIGNAMWAAGAISQAFNNIVNDAIPGSRKVSSKYSNTFLYINKVWMDPMTNPVGPAIMQTKGGKSLKYSTRLEILLGGQLTAGIRRLTAKAKGLDYSYGIETKIKVLKNHLDAPHNVTYEGKMIATDTGFISLDELDDFKKNHIAKTLKELNDLAEGDFEVDESDITYDVEEVTDLSD